MPTLLNILIKMKNDGLSESHIKNTDKALRRIAKDTDLNNPDAVKHFIANLPRTTGYKKNLTLAYNKYCDYYQIQWEMPTYYQESKLQPTSKRQQN